MIRFGSTRRYQIGELVRVPDQGLLKIVYLKRNKSMYRYYGYLI